MSATSANGLLALCGSFMALSTTAVGLRIYGRKNQGLSLGLDDWTALFGVVSTQLGGGLARHTNTNARRSLINVDACR